MLRPNASEPEWARVTKCDAAFRNRDEYWIARVLSLFCVSGTNLGFFVLAHQCDVSAAAATVTFRALACHEVSWKWIYARGTEWGISAGLSDSEESILYANVSSGMITSLQKGISTFWRGKKPSTWQEWGEVAWPFIWQDSVWAGTENCLSLAAILRTLLDFRLLRLYALPHLTTRLVSFSRKKI